MFYYIMLSSLIISASIFLYNIDAYNIITTTIDRKYKKWKKINTLVATQHNSLIEIYKISLKMIFQALYLSLIQYMNNSVIKLDKNTFVITYIIKGKIYKMILVPERKPSKILQIMNENEIDVTEKILSYYGSNYDWHNVSIIPQFFNCKKLTFLLEDGTEIAFNELDYITKLE